MPTAKDVQNVHFSRSLGYKSVVAVGCLLSACASSLPAARVIPTWTSNVVNYPGFATFHTPRTFDGPGTILRVDRDGHRHLVAELGPKIPPEHRSDGLEIPFVVRATLVTDTGLLARFLKSGDAQGAAATTGEHVKVELQLGESCLRERTTDHVHALAVAELQTLPLLQGDYYLIRETIAAKSLSFILTRESYDRLAAALGSGEHVKLRAENNLLSKESLEFTPRTFDVPHRVFYLAEQIVPINGKGAGAKSEFLFVPATQGLSCID